MFFKKKSSPPPERHARIPQQSARSGAVFSYHANRSVREGALARNADSQQQAEPARRNPTAIPWQKKLPTFGILLAIVLICFVCLQLSSKAKVVTLGADKSQVFLRDTNVYADAAQKAFTSLLNSNKLTVNAGKIAADLQKQFPELKAVSVSLPVVGSTPVVYIQPTVPSIILVSSQGMYLLDSNGRALITGNQVSTLDKLDIPVVTDQSNLPIKVGEIALPRSTMAFIDEVHGQLKAKNLPITSLVLPPGTNELHVKLQGAGYYVKFNLHGKAREEVGTFLAVKAQLESQHKTAKEYIDVRVENKAYYK